MISNKVIFGIMDEQARGNSSPTANSTNESSDVLALKENNTTMPKLATFEKDYWVLDGSHSFFVPSSSARRANGWWSSVLSNDDRSFDVNPEIDITFVGEVSSVGLTFIFESGNVVSDFKVDWYFGGELVSTYNVTANTESVCVVNNVITAYDRLHVTILKTQYPQRFAKLIRIDYGIGREISNDEIVSMSASLSVNLISRELPVSSLTLQVYSEEAEFSILNPIGVYLALKEKQKFDVYHDGELFARFYLKEWESVDNYNYTFVCDDAIGVMDGVTYYGGMYKAHSVKQLITDIVSAAGFEVEFEDTDIDSETVSGWLAVGSCREALHQVLFAVGRMAFTITGSDTISIRRHSTNTIVPTIDDMYTGEKLTLRDLVSAIELKVHDYTLQSTAQEIYSSELDVGDNRIVFSNPYAEYSVTGGEVIDSNCNYVTVRVSQKGIVSVNAKPYNDNTYVISEVLHVGAKENIVRVTDATLISPNSAPGVMSAMKQYYESRVQRDFSYDYEGRGKCGDSILVSNIFNTKNKCVIESLDIDLVTDIAAASMVVNDGQT